MVEVGVLASEVRVEVVDASMGVSRIGDDGGRGWGFW